MLRQKVHILISGICNVTAEGAYIDGICNVTAEGAYIDIWDVKF